MKQNYTDITVVIDRSGSMAARKYDTIGGFNTFLDAQRTVPGEATVTYVQFDDVVETVYTGMQIKDAPRMTELNYVIGQNTALYDAIGTAINNTGARLSNMPESERPSKVTLVIFTDGVENVSKFFNKHQIADMVKHQREKYSWEIVFMGANQNAAETGMGLNIDVKNTLTYAASAAGTCAAFQSATSNMRSYRTGAAKSMNFSEADKAKQDKELQKK